jgi:Hexapeptide repeat of succinyl-transferase
MPLYVRILPNVARLRSRSHAPAEQVASQVVGPENGERLGPVGPFTGGHVPPPFEDDDRERKLMFDHQRELSLWQAVRARRRHREAEVIPFKKAQLRIDGAVTGGGRLEIGNRWPGAFFEPTTFIVEDGGEFNVEGTFALYGGASLVVASGGVVEAKGGGGLNNGASISCFERITIGEVAFIGPDVLIRDSDSHVTSTGTRPPTQPITIGDHVWIGARAIILKGVTIGDGASVAAGSIVTKDVAPRTLVAGNPARVLREATWT